MTWHCIFKFLFSRRMVLQFSIYSICSMHIEWNSSTVTKVLTRTRKKSFTFLFSTFFLHFEAYWTWRLHENSDGVKKETKCNILNWATNTTLYKSISYRSNGHIYSQLRSPFITWAINDDRTDRDHSTGNMFLSNKAY